MTFYIGIVKILNINQEYLKKHYYCKNFIFFAFSFYFCLMLDAYIGKYVASNLSSIILVF